MRLTSGVISVPPAFRLGLVVIALALSGCATRESQGSGCPPGPCAATIDLRLDGGDGGGPAWLVATFTPVASSEAYANPMYAGIWLPTGVRALEGNSTFRADVDEGAPVEVRVRIERPTTPQEIRAFATFTRTTIGAPGATDAKVYRLTPDLHLSGIAPPSSPTARLEPESSDRFSIEINTPHAAEFNVGVRNSTNFRVSLDPLEGEVQAQVSLRGHVLQLETLPNGRHDVASIQVGVSPHLIPSRLNLQLSALVEGGRVVDLFAEPAPERADTVTNGTPTQT